MQRSAVYKLLVVLYVGASFVGATSRNHSACSDPGDDAVDGLEALCYVMDLDSSCGTSTSTIRVNRGYKETRCSRKENEWTRGIYYCLCPIGTSYLTCTLALWVYRQFPREGDQETALNFNDNTICRRILEEHIEQLEEEARRTTTTTPTTTTTVTTTTTDTSTTTTTTITTTTTSDDVTSFTSATLKLLTTTPVSSNVSEGLGDGFREARKTSTERRKLLRRTTRRLLVLSTIMTVVLTAQCIIIARFRRELREYFTDQRRLRMRSSDSSSYSSYSSKGSRQRSTARKPQLKEGREKHSLKKASTGKRGTRSGMQAVAKTKSSEENVVDLYNWAREKSKVGTISQDKKEDTSKTSTLEG